MFTKLLSIMDCGEAVDILTVIASEPEDQKHIGTMLIIHGDGQVDGQVDAEFIQLALDKVRTMGWSKPVDIMVEDSLGRKYRIFWDRITNHLRAIVFGGGHISQALISILSLLDFAVTVVDDRPEFANQSRFPGAQQVVCDSFQHFLRQDLMIDNNTAVIIVTRGHRYDLECLRATMHSNARYLGMIGSRRRIRELLQVVKQEGAPLDLAERLKAPIGLDIHAETPAEIAVSIAAELVATFRGGTGVSLSSRKEVF